MARSYDDTDTDVDLLKDWQDTGLFYDRVIKSHRAPKSATTRRAVIIAASALIATSASMSFNAFNTNDARTVRTTPVDDESMLASEMDRQDHIDESSRDAYRVPLTIVSKNPMRESMRGSKPHVDIKHSKRDQSASSVSVNNILWYTNRNRIARQ